jgi:hypothetical protein
MTHTQRNALLELAKAIAAGNAVVKAAAPNGGDGAAPPCGGRDVEDVDRFRQGRQRQEAGAMTASRL